MRILPGKSPVATATIGVAPAGALRAEARVRRRVIAARVAMIATSAVAPAVVRRVRVAVVQSRVDSEARVASGMIADFATSETSVPPSRRRRAFRW